MPSTHLILHRPLLLLPPIPPSITVSSSESTLRMKWPKYWSFSFSIIPSKEIPGLISFRMDWLDLLAVQWTLKSLLQHYSSKAIILRRSAFFTVQLSHPYMTIGKTIALTRQTNVRRYFICKFMIPILFIIINNFRYTEWRAEYDESPYIHNWDSIIIKIFPCLLYVYTFSSLSSNCLKADPRLQYFLAYTSLL